MKNIGWLGSESLILPHTTLTGYPESFLSTGAESCRLFQNKNEEREENK